MEKCKHHSKEVQHLSRKVDFLDSPERKKIFPPEELLKMLPIKNTDNILDLGAGTGYLAIPVAQMVAGTVYALDLDHRMLAVIASKAQSKDIANIKLLEGSIDDIPLPDASIDIALASLVLHEFNPLSVTLQQINRVLKEGGYFLCFEYEKIEDAVEGPPVNIRIASSTMEQELINAGFNIVEKLFMQDYLYVFVVRKGNWDPA